MAEAKTALLRDASEAPVERRADSDVPEAGGILTIDLGAVVANWFELGRRAMPSECAAVIKADGYGCGIEPVARVLAAAGCKTFFVADLSEGASRTRGRGGAGNLRAQRSVAGHGRRLCRHSGASRRSAAWSNSPNGMLSAAANEWRGGAALHVDTGMNRLGISPDEAAALCAPRIRAEKHGITLLMSHLVSAEQPTIRSTNMQIKLFREVRLLYRGIPGFARQFVRHIPRQCRALRHGPARALRCLASTRPRDGEIPMRPVVDLQARVVQVRTVPKGESVGYNATWTAKHATRIAVVAVGYADGYPRAASATDAAPGAEAIVGGTRCPIAGRVSMDLSQSTSPLWATIRFAGVTSSR